jgi:hypothetical protein
MLDLLKWLEIDSQSISGGQKTEVTCTLLLLGQALLALRPEMVESVTQDLETKPAKG